MTPPVVASGALRGLSGLNTAAGQADVKRVREMLRVR